MPSTALQSLSLPCVQVVQKKYPMKCAGVTGRQLRATGVIPCSHFAMGATRTKSGIRSSGQR